MPRYPAHVLIVDDLRAVPAVGFACKEEDLIEGVECGGVARFVDEAKDADIVLTFCQERVDRTAAPGSRNG